MIDLRRRGVRMGLVALAASTVWDQPAVAQTRYTPSWTSLDTHNPAPEWFQDAKFGIYYHWGPWCVAAYGSEWYPRNMYNRGSGEYNNHTAKYGDPFGEWGYDKFLTGANDKQGRFAQFAPQLKSEGGAWDPDEWAQAFLDAGARFAGPVAEHHDGFSMWDSKVNEWNSVAVGPKLDLGKLQADAIRKKGMKLIMSHHTAYHFTGYYQWAPQGATDSLKKLYGQLPKATEETLWLNKLKEIIDAFKPDIIWQDFNLGQISEANLMAFLAYYYNTGLDANVEVVATAKDGILSPHKGQVRDYERGGPADITTPYWLTDDAVSSSSWSYTAGMRYYSMNALIHSFVDRVSKGGNLLLNLSPMADGTFPQEQKSIMAEFGKFLKQNGTAIYNTRTFAVYGEGPTKMGGGGMGAPTAMTSSDVRYTRSKDGDAVYALLMGWPGDGKEVTLAAVTTSRFALGSGKVFMFGPNGDGIGESVLQATQDGSGLRVTLPSTQPYAAVAYALKISKSGKPPEATPWIGVSPSPDGGVDGTGGSGGADDGGIPGTGGNTGAGGGSGAGGATAAPQGSGGNRGGTGGRGSGGTSGFGGASDTGGARVQGGSSGAASAGAMGSGGGVASGGAPAPGGSAGSGEGGAGSGGSSTPTTMGGGSSSGCSCTIHGSVSSSAGGAGLLLGFIIACRIRRRRHRLVVVEVSNRGVRRRMPRTRPHQLRRSSTCRRGTGSG